MRKRLIVIISAVLAILGAGAGIAFASIPGPDGVIHGCYKTSNPGQGALLAIDSAASCPSGTTALNWNQTGPQGPSGPQGSPGLSGINVVVSPSITDSNPHETDCASGQVALSVVFNQVNAGVFDQWISTQPVLNGTGQPVGYTYQSDNTIVYRANVTCAIAAS